MLAKSLEILKVVHCRDDIDIGLNEPRDRNCPTSSLTLNFS